jgi:hypothetical protein
MDTEFVIVAPTPDFNFKSITLADPQPLNGSTGFYFTQLTTSNAAPLCLQLPECLTKQGIVTIKNGKYLDLMFERASNDELMRWIEQLEYTCQDLIDSKKELWFQTELTRDDIETMMSQVARLYQSGKYMLMRVFVDKCIAYDENEIGFDLDTLEPNKQIIPLIMIEGVKFSSRSFEISLKLVQVMVIGQTDKKSSCLIKRVLLEKGPQNDLLENVLLEKGPQNVLLEKGQQNVLLEKGQQNPLEVVVGKVQNPLEVPQHPLANVPQTPLAKVPQTPLAQPPLAQPPLAKASAGGLGGHPLQEVTLNYTEIEDSIRLKNPNDVYLELYKKAREKAKQCRMAAIDAYLEAKQIKTKYMLFDEDDSDDISDDISDDEQ